MRCWKGWKLGGLEDFVRMLGLCIVVIVWLGGDGGMIIRGWLMEGKLEAILEGKLRDKKKRRKNQH